MKTVQVYRERDLTDPMTELEAVAVSGRIEGCILLGADKSDPLNQLVVAGIKIPGKFAIRVTVTRYESKEPENEALGLLAEAIVQCHSEIRDALAE